MNRIIRRWHDMIRIDSINGHEVGLAEYIAKELESFDMDVKWDYFEDDVEKVRPSIYTVLDSGKPGRTLMFIGHIDTVKVAEGWNTDPFVPTEIGDKTYGLGAMDMKGGLAAIIDTLEYYSVNKDKFSGKILACFVSDEENLSEGTYSLMQSGITADMAIMAECRYDNMAIGFRGRYSIEVIVKGEAAHASRYPYVGENALISAGKLAEAIEALPTLKHPDLREGTWCVRYIEGGVKNALIVPERCEIFVDRYVVPGETYEICEQQILKAAENIGLAGKVEVRLKARKNPYMQSFALSENHELVLAVKEQFRSVTGKELALEYDPSVCDSNILAATYNIPTITFGPSGSGMHAANEYGYKYQVENCRDIYIKTVEVILN